VSETPISGGLTVQNTHGVTHYGNTVRILNPPRGRLTADEAKAYAAWLVLAAERVDPDGVPIEQVLDAVRMTNLGEVQ
jgi:hypothetical protein